MSHLCYLSRCSLRKAFFFYSGTAGCWQIILLVSIKWLYLCLHVSKIGYLVFCEHWLFQCFRLLTLLLSSSSYLKSQKFVWLCSCICLNAGSGAVTFSWFDTTARNEWSLIVSFSMLTLKLCALRGGINASQSERVWRFVVKWGDGSLWGLVPLVPLQQQTCRVERPLETQALARVGALADGSVTWALSETVFISLQDMKDLEVRYKKVKILFPLLCMSSCLLTTSVKACFFHFFL